MDTPRENGMVNALSVDVEDYFMVSSFAASAPLERWSDFPSRIGIGTGRLLDLLDAHGVKGTFFVVGWIAERHPGVVRDIRSRGHEIGCHGYAHRLVYDLSPREFREDTRRAKGALEDLTGERIAGYRAPSYSVTRRSLWALEILVGEGFLYDSSIFPVLHDRYGIPGFSRTCGWIGQDGAGRILEVPPSTLRILGRTVPFAGGGYLRLYPAGLTAWGIKRLNEEEGHPAVVYVHPWEVDPDPPRLAGSLLSRFRHYVNIRSTEEKLRFLLGRFRFAPVRDVYASVLEGRAPREAG